MKFAIFFIFAFLCLTPLARAFEKHCFLEKPACDWIVSSGATQSTTDAEDQYCFVDCDIGPAPLSELVTSLTIYEAEIMKAIGFQPVNPVIPQGDGKYTLIDLDRELYRLLLLALEDPQDPLVCEFLIWHVSSVGLLVDLPISPEDVFARVLLHLTEYFRKSEDVEAYCSLWLDPLF